ncbi:MAG: FAD-dependent oxidoreductase [Candidatus Eremiobacteraeota bacterium]|nr:FAD-dependent oxidoreductase [Candidatus Eremiobacteraeota bacterium]
MSERTLSATVCIVGGGPCGMMLGVLLARAGIDVVVLEKYKDFFRDFRGDTIHPSTLQLLYELGWLDEFLALPHDEMREISAYVGGETVAIGDLTHLPTTCKFVAFMPQWDFLNFLAARAKAYPTFHLLMETEGIDVVEKDGAVTGVRARDKDGEFTISAKLVVGTDGRHSTIRDRAGFVVDNVGAPMDVLWMRISKEPGDPVRPLGTLVEGRLLVMIDRGEYWQCAYIIRKGSFDAMKAAGLAAFHKDLVAIIPELADRVAEIDDWSKVSLLEVRVDRLERWHRPGVLCIGDAAHAMSPIGGVGINLAIQDAVAAANLLWKPLLDGTLSDGDLARVQARRTFPTKVTQGFQVFIQNHGIDPILRGDVELNRPPLLMRLLEEFPRLRRLPARMIGIGVRPEHVHAPAASFT